MPQTNRIEQLERLIMGLEMSIENTREMLPHYKPGDIEGVYAKKFLAASEEQLLRSRKELAELLASSKTSPPLPRPLPAGQKKEK